jgi:hypothetical protein
MNNHANRVAYPFCPANRVAARDESHGHDIAVRRRDDRFAGSGWELPQRQTAVALAIVRRS